MYQGKKPYVIPVGGSNGTGAARYVNAMFELDLQITKNCFTQNQTVLFWHTGGTPELFAWSEQFRNCC